MYVCAVIQDNKFWRRTQRAATIKWICFGCFYRETNGFFSLLLWLISLTIQRLASIGWQAQIVSWAQYLQHVWAFISRFQSFLLCQALCITTIQPKPYDMKWCVLRLSVCFTKLLPHHIKFNAPVVYQHMKITVKNLINTRQPIMRLKPVWQSNWNQLCICYRIRSPKRSNHFAQWKWYEIVGFHFQWHFTYYHFTL